MILVFDIGATTTRVGVSEDGKTFSKTIAFPTEQDVEAALKQLRHETLRLTAGKPERIVVGIAGTLDRDRMRLMRSWDLSLWEDAPLRERLEQEFGAPVMLENDAALGGLGEAASGAGKGYAIVAYITHSTGVGGCRIVHGKIDESALGFEPGKMIVRDGQTLEGCISGKALHERNGKPAADISDEVVWRTVEDDLATGFANVTVLWSPNVIVLGGGVALKGPMNLKRVQDRFAELCPTFSFSLPEIKLAALGDDAGLWGGLTLSQ